MNCIVMTMEKLQVRCWEITKSGTSVGSVGKASIAHDQPVMLMICVIWNMNV